MEGASLRAERDHNRDITLAWHTAIFALNGYSGKLKGKSLADYLVGKEKPKRSGAARALAFFHAMKSAGFDVKIERVERS